LGLIEDLTPFSYPASAHLRKHGPAGYAHADSKEARRLIDKLGLDRPKLRGFRELWISIIRVAAKHDPVLFVKLMGFPEDLPDLSKLRLQKGNGTLRGFHARPAIRGTSSAWWPPVFRERRRRSTLGPPLRRRSQDSPTRFEVRQKEGLTIGGNSNGPWAM
jgi:hypothetical protein